MRRSSTALLTAATVLLPMLSAVAHADGGLGSPDRNREVAVTGHAEPEPALHLEERSGTVDLHCLGCLLDKRQPAQAPDARSVSKPETRGPRGRPAMTARLALELPAYRSPRAPPAV